MLFLLCLQRYHLMSAMPGTSTLSILWETEEGTIIYKWKLSKVKTACYYVYRSSSGKLLISYSRHTIILNFLFLINIRLKLQSKILLKFFKECQTWTAVVLVNFLPNKLEKKITNERKSVSSLSIIIAKGQRVLAEPAALGGNPPSSSRGHWSPRCADGGCDSKLTLLLESFTRF